MSRRELFDRLDRPVLNPLPETPTSMPNGCGCGSGWTITSRSPAAAYSVPHALIRQEVEVRLGARTVEVFRAAAGSRPIRARSGAPASR